MKVDIIVGLGLVLSFCSASFLKHRENRKRTIAALADALQGDHAPLVSKYAKLLGPTFLTEIVKIDIAHAEKHPNAHFELLKAYENKPNAIIALCLIFKHLQGDTLKAAKVWLNEAFSLDKEKAFMEMSTYSSDKLFGVSPFVLPLLPQLQTTSLIRLTQQMLSVRKIKLASLLVKEVTQTLCKTVPQMLKAASSVFNTDLFRKIAEHPQVTLEEKAGAVQKITNSGHLAILHGTVKPNLIPSYLDHVLPYITAPHLTVLMQRCPSASAVLEATLKRWMELPPTDKSKTAVLKLVEIGVKVVGHNKQTSEAQATVYKWLLQEQSASSNASKRLPSHRYAEPEEEEDTETPEAPPQIVMKTRRLRAKSPKVEGGSFFKQQQ